MKSILLFAFAALVVLGGLGLGYYYYMGSSTPPTYKTAAASTRRPVGNHQRDGYAGTRKKSWMLARRSPA